MRGMEELSMKYGVEVAGEEQLLVSPAVSVAVRKLGSAIRDDISVRWKLTDALEKMKTMLETIEIDLAEAERLSTREAAVRQLLKALKDLAYSPSDTLDEYCANKKPAPAPGTLTWMVLCLRTVSKITMARKINMLLKKLIDISESFRHFQFINANLSMETSSFQPVNIVGRGGAERYIVKLLSASATQQGPIILPIVGKGGVGKTTLAQMIFNNPRFSNYSRAWVCVSEEFDLRKIGLSLLSLISPVTANESLLSIDTFELMIHYLRAIPRGNIFIVLDDIWVDDHFQLNLLKRLISSVGEEGSEVIVIITTRNEVTAGILCTLQPYWLSPLTDYMCWQIIQQSSGFQYIENQQELEHVGQMIAIKCGGLPLAAKVFGQMLRSEDASGWSALMNRDAWNIKNDEGLDDLKLKFLSMPLHLRSCFAYLAIFPSGHHIVKHELIHQWIAAGLVEQPVGSTLSNTDLAEHYINELLRILFLQNPTSALTSEKNEKNVTFFNTHVLLHDLAISAMGSDFINRDGRGGASSRENNCRYALLTNFEGTPKLSSILPSRLRVLRFQGCNGIELSEDAFSFAKYLLVLDLSECSVKKLPASIGQLKCLRYLNAPRIQDAVFPAVITRLSRLIYLGLHGTSKISKLRESIDRLEDLVHVDLSGCSGLETLPESFGNIKCLVHLDLSGCSKLKTLPESFKSLKNLVHLDLSECSCLQGVIDALHDLSRLRYLNLSHPCGYFVEDRFHLSGLNEVLPKLEELQYLNLSMCLNPLCFTLEPEDGLAYVAKCITGLGKLEHLDLSHNKFLSELPSESLAGLTKMHTLVLSGCFRLKSLPKCIANLSELSKIDLSGCPHLESLPNSIEELRFALLQSHENNHSHEEEIKEVKEPHCSSQSTSRG
ncbi:putative disease resistance protein RGA3 isoform X1 [Oryza brachyantha]|nr:putative disease resistance protein RGA3 isoform X1 [Oryza brachyantha]